MSRLKLFIPLLIFLLLSIMFYAVEKQVSRGEYDPQSMPSALIGREFPVFALPDLLSGEHLDRGLLLGRLSIVNVWATWCPTCHYEHPYLVQLSSRQDLQIIGIDYKDNADRARQWLESKGNPYRYTVFDAAGTLGLDLGVTGAPETFIVDAEGVVRLRYQGALDEAAWQKHFAPVIASLRSGAVQ